MHRSIDFGTNFQTSALSSTQELYPERKSGMPTRPPTRSREYTRPATRSREVRTRWNNKRHQRAKTFIEKNMIAHTDIICDLDRNMDKWCKPLVK